MRRVLKGLKVLELSTMITGPLAGMLLADLGADVIKVERPEGGDPLRNYGGGKYGPNFCAYNRNKRSIVLDLRSEPGLRAVRELVRRSDVLLDNFRPGVMARLGFTQEHLDELNPKLIWCSITGFGDGGPYVDKPAYDAVAQALSGMTGLFVDADDPKIAGPTLADNAAGIFACYGIMAALIDRSGAQSARRIEVNMLDAALAFMPDPFHYFGQLGIVSDPYVRARISQSYAFRCRNGRMVCIHLSSQQKFWLGFLRAVQREDLQSDSRFVTREARVERYQELVAELKDVFLTRTVEEWVTRLSHEDVPCAPAYQIDEVFADPQVRHLDSFVDLIHPVHGAVRSVRRPVWINGSRDDQPMVPPPVLGEHGDEILSEIGLARVGETPAELA